VGKDKQTKTRIFQESIPIILGFFSFALVVGIDRLNPTSVTWLSKGAWGDLWVAYLGWINFRNSPWSLPLGLNPQYGVELSNSVVYTDSIPILAIIFKFFSPILPGTFQYFGLWYLVCFLSTSYLGWRIISLFTNDVLIKTFGSLITIFSPIVIHRINVHAALVGQFLILAGIFLQLSARQKTTFRGQVLLAVVSAGVHPYLMVMNLLLMASTLADKLKKGRLQIRKIVSKVLVFTLLLVFSMYLYGYFVVSSDIQTKFNVNLFKMDLLQPVNVSGWSYLASRWFPEAQGNFDGFNYFGLAALTLLFVASFQGKKLCSLLMMQVARRKSLVFVLSLMLFYSLSNIVTFARYPILSISMPGWFIELTSTFRGAGRFFWPVFYFILFFLMLAIVKIFSNRSAVVIFALASILHIADSSYAWQRVKSFDTIYSSNYFPSYSEDEWIGLREKYGSIRVYPKFPSEESCDWKRIGLIAGNLDFSTNCIQSARINSAEIRQDQIDFIQEIRSSNFMRSDSIYVVDRDSNPFIFAQLQATSTEKLVLDGMYLFFVTARG